MSDRKSSILSRSGVGLSRLSSLSWSVVCRLTLRSTSVFGSISRLQATGRFLRRHLWAWPVIAAFVFGVAGWSVQRAVDGAMREQRAAELTTILNADVKALRVWMTDQGRNAEFLSDDDRLRPAITALLALPTDGPEADRGLLLAAAQADLRARLGPRLKKCGYNGFFLVSPAGVVIGCDEDMAIGKPLTGYRKVFFDRVRTAGTSVSKPYRSDMLLKDEAGELRSNLPTMLVAAPVRDAAGRVDATLGFRIRPEEEFTQILHVARAGESGETYAVDRSGLFLSNSRFDDDLKRIGLLPELPELQSVLTLSARDPGGDMTTGARPTLRRQDQPLTRGVADAAEGRTGCDPDGYRDYRGVPVVGAWTWLPEYDFGVVTEIDRDEAFVPVFILRRAIWALLGLLALAAVGIFVAMLFIARQQKALQRAALENKTLGQYTLLDKIGAGGMGTVYRAQHAMLRRPTAIKLLNVDNISEAAVGRFEREVQMTASLTHPNTVAIFDYGRTPEGIFYYAMELLEGSNLDDLVGRAGPLPDARVMHFLRQVCGSLAEAHATGLVHRDIKPANLFVSCRGGMHDFIKVLDFGLVKSVGGAAEGNITSAGAVTGTPLYMPPEAVNRPDDVSPRSDVYAIGAVGYFLLTGRPVFAGESVVEILMKHVSAAPESPSVVAGRAIASDLEQLVLRCLAKSPGDRSADAGTLLRELDGCVIDGRWTTDDAAAWWASAPAKPVAPPTMTVCTPSATNMTSAYVGDAAELDGAKTVHSRRPPT